MVDILNVRCPDCGDAARYYDSVKRKLRIEYGKSTLMYIKRYKCVNCGRIHRLLSADILPFKHYKAEIVFGVLSGRISSECVEYEDYPTELTMKRWKTELADIFTEIDFTNVEF